MKRLVRAELGADEGSHACCGSGIFRKGGISDRFSRAEEVDTLAMDEPTR
jgi:hypothetical protein